ncbi:MAG: sulfurtransferase [Thaumarchaeota archaeon]|nr:sulfurtransferase [Nitrososphaerota archaeon]
MFISVTELKEILKIPELVLVDTRTFKEYSSGHIPGAVNLDLFAYHWSDTSEDGTKAFNTQMQKLLSNVGITNDKKVVFYDEVSGMTAARGVWILTYFSHSNVFMLDGGIRSWKSSNLPIEKQTNAFKPNHFLGNVNKSVFSDFNYIKENLERIKLIDARTKEEFDGTIVRAARSGHIPNAINVDWNLNIEKDGTMKKNEELSLLYKFSKDDEIVTYCQGAYRAANTFLALKKLGFKNVKVYLGSWSEWGNRLELPVA